MVVCSMHGTFDRFEEDSRLPDFNQRLCILLIEHLSNGQHRICQRLGHLSQVLEPG
jgi:hypothetical protein